MKDNKICFPKTLTYLVLLVLAVVGGFWVINYTNTQKLGANPEAAFTACKEKGVRGISIKLSTTRTSCASLNLSKDIYRNAVDYNVPGFICCISQRQPNAYSVGDTKESCQRIKNIIAKKFPNGSCTYYIGEVSSQGRCKVETNANSLACRGNIGTLLSDGNALLKSLCGGFRNKFVVDSVKIAGNGNRTCLVYDGGFRSGNKGAALDSRVYCSTTNKADILDKVLNGFRTGNCGNVM